jgi:hypothetical protein
MKLPEKQVVSIVRPRFTSLDLDPILHTAWLYKHSLTLKRNNTKNIILMKNPVFCIPS